MRVRIRVPTFNESANIEAILRRIFHVAPSAEVLVIDDSSPDGTATLVQGLLSDYPNLRLLVRPRREGLGKAYLAGIVESLDQADVLIMDADFSHDPAHLPALIDAARSHDLAIGSRYVKGGGAPEWESWRKLLSLGGNRYSRAITGMPVSDATSGFQALRTQMLEHVEVGRIAASGYAFQIELKYCLWKSGASIAEVPIVFRSRRGGESKLTSHIVREGICTPWRLRFSATAARPRSLPSAARSTPPPPQSN